MAQVLNPETLPVTYVYDAADRRTVKRLANGTRTSFSYDAADRTTRVANLKSSGVVISQFDYRYDNTSNRVGVTEASGDRVTWTYDASNQLTRERRSGVNGYDVTHVYDPVGNRTLKRDGSSRTTTVYNGANRIVSSQDGSGRTTITYDADGNLTKEVKPSGQITTSVWDAENMNGAVLLPDTTRVTYTYNGNHQRVRKDAAGGTRKYVYNLANLLTETDAGNVTQAVYTMEPVQYGNLVSQRQLVGASWSNVYYHYDALGSTDSLSDGMAVVTDTYTYTAFGETKASTGTTTNLFTWVGELGYVRDTETGEFGLRERQYQPNRARFKSQDPLGPNVDANEYRYVGNNAVHVVDPSGKVWIVCQCSAGPYGRGDKAGPEEVSCESTISTCCNDVCNKDDRNWTGKFDYLKPGGPPLPAAPPPVPARPPIGECCSNDLFGPIGQYDPIERMKQVLRYAADHGNIGGGCGSRLKDIVADEWNLTLLAIGVLAYGGAHAYFPLVLVGDAIAALGIVMLTFWLGVEARRIANNLIDTVDAVATADSCMGLLLASSYLANAAKEICVTTGVVAVGTVVGAGVARLRPRVPCSTGQPNVPAPPVEPPFEPARPQPEPNVRPPRTQPEPEPKGNEPPNPKRPGPRADIPKIKVGTIRDMLREVLAIMRAHKNMEQEALADLFEGLAQQISDAHPEWTASRDVLSDGTIAFIGEQANNVFAIKADGRMFKSNPARPPLIFKDGGLVLDYSVMEPVE